MQSISAPNTAPVVVQAREISSPTMAQVVKSSPAPPYSSGMGIPIRSISAICRIFSQGISPLSSTLRALGLRTPSAYSLTISIIICCSSERLKFTLTSPPVSALMISLRNNDGCRHHTLWHYKAREKGLSISLADGKINQNT